MLMRAAMLGLCVTVMLFTGCSDEDKAVSRARAEASRELDKGNRVRIGSFGEQPIYQVQVNRVGGYQQQLFVIPNASTTFTESCGKSCTRDVTTASPSPIYAGLAGLTPEQRLALGLPDAADPRVSGLAKLTDAEKRALGIEHIENELFPRVRGTAASAALPSQ